MASTFLAEAFGRRLLRTFSWKCLLVFFAFTAALAAWTWSGVLLAAKPMTFDEHAQYLLGLFQRNLLGYFPIYLLVGLADGTAVQGRRRLALLVAALVGGVLLAVQVRCAASPHQMFYVYSSTQIAYCTSFPTWRTYIDFFNSSVITPLTISAMVMVFVFGRRRDRELVEALGMVRAAQLEARRQRIEADLAAMQSRVDPDELLDTLRDIRARYEASPDEGESRLDRLIADLREAASRPAAVAGQHP